MTREEAINVIRSIYQTGAEREALAILVPELRESEDERIRKWLLECVENLSDGNFIAVSRQDVLFYLEKQKEQRPVQSKEEKEYVRTLKGLVSDFIRDSGGGITDVEYYQNICDWLDGRHIEQKPVVTHGETYHVDTLGTQQVIAGKMPQKSAEWSEENEDMLNSCISSIEEAKENRYAYKETDGDTSYDHEIDWLKSLRPVSKESLQPHWKPSEGQMSMLLAVINDPNNAGSASCHIILKSLYNDLKKLGVEEEPEYYQHFDPDC